MDLDLRCHPDTPSGAVTNLNAGVRRIPRGLDLCFVIEGLTSKLSIPPPAKPYRTDGLWRTTCLELFASGQEPDYREFNFSPSTQWAAYQFTGYREGMEALGLDEPPQVCPSDEGYALIVSLTLRLDLPPRARIGLSAVIEEADGRKSYWALAHPPGPPDFHHPDCFTLQLPAPGET